MLSIHIPKDRIQMREGVFQLIQLLFFITRDLWIFPCRVNITRANIAIDSFLHRQQFVELPCQYYFFSYLYTFLFHEKKCTRKDISDLDLQKMTRPMTLNQLLLPVRRGRLASDVIYSAESAVLAIFLYHVFILIILTWGFSIFHLI